MSKEREPCQIIENAKTKAKNMGLDSKEVCCPAEHVCGGSICIFNGEPVPDMGQVEKFKLRFQRTGALKERLEKGKKK